MYNGPDPLRVVPGPLHLALVGADARGLSHASRKRRVVLCFMKRAAMSGNSFFKAVVSRRLLVTFFQVTFQPKPSKVSIPLTDLA